MTFTTESALKPLRPGPDPTWTGGFLCIAGFAAIAMPSLLAAAVGIELLAAGFWFWGRAAEDRAAQLPRWSWLRRPASALWLAAGVQAVFPEAIPATMPGLQTLPGLAWRLQSLAIIWGALELMAALPLARPFSDRPGPLSVTGPWLPVMLPAAGFLVLWRHADVWSAVPVARSVALWLVLPTALLAAIRAFGLRPWTASLRWLAVTDCAFAGVLLALHVVPAESALLLWVGAFGGHSLLLASELGGSLARRSRVPLGMWRVSGIMAITMLSWPVLVTLGFGPPQVANPVLAGIAAAAVALQAWVSMRGMVEAPERRAMVRREAAVSLIQVGALACLLAGPSALALAWQAGFQPSWLAALASFAPGILASWAGGLRVTQRTGIQPGLRAQSDRARRAARGAFHAIVRFERRVVALLRGLGLALIAPARDLHTGDAQEFLLFLAGVAVLSLVLPLLR